MTHADGHMLHMTVSRISILTCCCLLLIASRTTGSPQEQTSNRWVPLLDLAKVTVARQRVAEPSVDGKSILESNMREGRHFSTMDACQDSMCDQVLRQAHGLSRLKLLRKYIRETVGMLDRLVTALDAEMIISAKTLSTSLGTTCRAAHAILSNVEQISFEADRGNLNNRQNQRYPFY